jgi:hypothetical protein
MKKVLYGVSGKYDLARPGQSTEITFDLSKLCKFDEDGTYEIIAGKNGLGPREKKRKINFFKVISNPLKVTVVPNT